MGCLRVLLCILLPPLAVLDFGCGSIAIVALLTLCGWVPGALAAVVICSMQRPPAGATVYFAPDGTRLLSQPAPPRAAKPLAMASAIIAVVVGAVILAQLSSLTRLKSRSVETPTMRQAAAAVSPTASTPRAPDAKASQQAAMRKYPQLAVANSSFNRAFLARYEEWKRSDDPRLSRSDWPELLADECANQAAMQQRTPMPAKSPIDVAAQLYSAASRAKTAATPPPAPAVPRTTGRVWVKPYRRKDGTYVEGYYRDQ